MRRIGTERISRRVKQAAKGYGSGLLSGASKQSKA